MALVFHKIIKCDPKLYGGGLFVHKDINGKDCHIGDRVRVTRCEASWDVEDYNGTIETYELEEKIWEGVLILRKSTGVWVKTNDKKYIRPKYGQSLIKWKWELL